MINGLKQSARHTLEDVLLRWGAFDRKHFFFVRGYMRSGTNWVGNLLNKHPDISCAGEFHLRMLCDEYRRLVFGTPPETWGVMRRLRQRRRLEREFERMIRRFVVAGNINDAGFRPLVRWYGDRSPQPLEPIALPGASHILIVRDGRDCLVSETFHFLRMGDIGDHPFEEHPQMLEKRGRFLSAPGYFDEHPDELLDDEGWVRSRARLWSQNILEDLASVERFEAGELDGRVQVVRFEDLHREVEAWRRRLYEFLGADPVAAAPLDELTVAGFGSTGARRAHYRSGKIGQWPAWEAPNTVSWYLDEAAAALEVYGYLEG